MDRRTFLMGSMGASVLAATSRRAVAAGDKVNVGMIGTANQAGWNMGQLAALPSVNIGALCDVDQNYLAAAAKRFPTAKTYSDYRKLLEHKGLDAVLIAIPDHNHAPATMAALQAGLHVYCEKPLSHTVAEARKVVELTRRHKRVTQMGTQIHAGTNYRRAVELVQGGCIGNVTEAHVFCGRVNAAASKTVDFPAVPATLDWNLWLGPAPKQQYSPAFVPFNWRWWWDFGGGTLGDMGCHYTDLAFWALELTQPTSVVAEGPEVDDRLTPIWMICRYEFPARGSKPPVKLTWYDGENKKPDALPESVRANWDNGVLFIGDKGMVLADYDRRMLLPEDKFAGFTPPSPTIPASIGHHNEWIQAIKSGTPNTTCRFEYSGNLTESVLLGNVSYRLGKKLQWDHTRLRATNCPEADALIQPHYLNGYKF